MNLYLVKMIEGIKDYGTNNIYPCYLFETNVFSKDIDTLIKIGKYEVISIPKDTAFTAFTITNFLNKKRLQATIKIKGINTNILFEDASYFKMDTILDLMSQVVVKKGEFPAKVISYFINGEMLFTLTHETKIKSFLKETKKERDTEKPRKITKSTLQPFTIYETDQGAYFYVLGIVNGLSKDFYHVSLYKKKKSANKDLIWCLKIPSNELIKKPLTEEEIIRLIKEEEYKFEQNIDVYKELHSFKEKGTLSFEKMVEIHNHSLIEYLQSDEEYNYSSHKEVFKCINYHSLEGTCNSNWLSHADCFLYLVNHPTYRHVLKDKAFNGVSVVEELFNQHKDILIDRFTNWHQTYAKQYQNKELTGKQLEEGTFIDYACFIALHLIEKASKQDLLAKTKAKPVIHEYEFNPLTMFESIKRLAIDTEQTFRYALLPNEIIVMNEPKYYNFNNKTFNVPLSSSYQGKETLYTKLNHEFKEIFNTYENMYKYYKEL